MKYLIVWFVFVGVFVTWTMLVLAAGLVVRFFIRLARRGGSQ